MIFFCLQELKMGIIRYLFLGFVLVVGCHAQFNNKSYINDKGYHCKKCPPGQYWVGDCTYDGGSAQCTACNDGEYIDSWNQAIFCSKCDTECKGNGHMSREEITLPCTPEHNIVCECKSGYWREQGSVGDCREVSPCHPGFGVKKLGKCLVALDNC